MNEQTVSIYYVTLIEAKMELAKGGLNDKDVDEPSSPSSGSQARTVLA